MRVLVVHNRYRVRGGEERAVDLQMAALRRAGVEARLLEADSQSMGSAHAAMSLLGGGQEIDIGGADVVHVHNMHPSFGPRALRSAREQGARVVLHLHNFRLFCSIATCFRDGEPCFRCRGRFTLPGLALNCRGSLPESATYTSALALHQPTVFKSVDAFVTPSRYAAGQLERLGLPRAPVVVPNYLPEFAQDSRAHEGRHAVCIGRLSPEKGFEVAAEAASISGVPLKIAGEGSMQVPQGVELLGHVDDVPSLLRGAAMAVVPSLGGDVMPFAALEAMAAGVPVIAARSGSLPELVGDENCVPRRDAGALASAMRGLWDGPEERRALGERQLAGARERFNEERYLRDILAVYEGTQSAA